MPSHTPKRPETTATHHPISLYGCTNSEHSYKVRLFLYLAEIPHHYHCVSLQAPKPERDPAFVAISKFGEVPVLVENGQALCQSNAILMHLARQYGRFSGTPALWPAITEWLFWEADRIGFSLSNLRFACKYRPLPPEVMDYLTDLTLTDLDTLEHSLADSEFLLPCGPTIADLGCASYLYWLHEARLSIDDFPNIRRWLKAIQNLPHWGYPDAILQPGSHPEWQS